MGTASLSSDPATYPIIVVMTLISKSASRRIYQLLATIIILLCSTDSHAAKKPLSKPKVSPPICQEKIIVQWRTVKNAGSYVVKLNDATATIGQQTTKTKAATFTDNLSAGTQYTISVQAKPSARTKRLFKASSASVVTCTVEVSSVPPTMPPSASPTMTATPTPTPTPTNTPTPTATPPAPSFGNATTTQLNNCNVWLFAVDDLQDGSGNVVLSGEGASKLKAVRMDLDSPISSPSWTDIATTADTGGTNIADHWHSFVNGSHYIVFATTTSRISYLTKFSTSLSREFVTTIVNTETASNGQPVLTNDMFMVPSASGLLIGHFVPNLGQKLYERSLTGAAIRAAEIGGGANTHSNGSSALSSGDGFVIYAPRTLNPTATSDLLRFTLNSSLAISASSTFLTETNTNHAMATKTDLPNGYYAITYRIRRDLSAAGDDGAIERKIYNSNDELIDGPDIIELDSSNRPHTTLIDNRFVTTYDKSGSCRLRVETIN